MNIGLLLQLLLICLPEVIAVLSCVQCDRNQNWYSPEENQRIIDLCQHGRLPPTRCANESATHCLFSYYKTSNSKTRTIMERRCGKADEIVGCTLYKSGNAVPQRVRRHLFSDADATVRRRDTKPNFFVEVCTGGCEEDGCLNVATGTPLLAPLLFILLRLMVG
uniref:Protein quiver n=2 Tax=Steinernema glaseri TaxID=37863 RepID=A0A1I7ZDW2_9BILA